MNRLLPLPGKRSGFSHLAKLNLGHHAQHMFLGFEVVEEGAFAHIGGFCNVLHRDVWEAVLCKELKRTPEEPYARLHSTPFAAPHTGRVGHSPGSESGYKSNRARYMTFIHLRPSNRYDFQSYFDTEKPFCQEAPCKLIPLGELPLGLLNRSCQCCD